MRRLPMQPSRDVRALAGRRRCERRLHLRDVREDRVGLPKDEVTIDEYRHKAIRVKRLVLGSTRLSLEDVYGRKLELHAKLVGDGSNLDAVRRAGTLIEFQRGPSSVADPDVLS